MQGRIQSLNVKVQYLLKLCSCIGNKFNLNKLEAITGQNKILLYKYLDVLVKKGFIFPSKNYKFFIDSNGIIDVSYRFLHDKIRQSALSLIGNKIEKYHLKIGRSLLRLDKLDLNTFNTINHLNNAKNLITSTDEIIQLAELNCIAGEKSRKTTAWSTSFNYFKFGINLLPIDCWKKYYELSLRLYSGICETAYLNHKYDETNKFCQILIKNTSLFDQVKAYEIVINSLIAQGNPKKAIDTGFNYLIQIGFRPPIFSNKLTILFSIIKTSRKLRKINFETLSFKKVTDPKFLAAIKIFMLLAPSLYVIRSPNFVFIVVTLINQFLKKGFHPAVSYGVVAFAGVLTGKLREYDLSYDLAKTAIRMVKSNTASPLSAKINYLASAFILPWREQYSSLESNLKKNFNIGLNHGDLEYASFCAYAYCYMSFLSGKRLNIVDQIMIRYSKKIKSQETICNYLNIYHQTVKNLINCTNTPTKLSGSVCDQSKLEHFFKTYQNDIGLFEINSNRFYLCYLFGDIKGADEIYRTFLRSFLPTALSKHNVPIVLFYRGLCIYSHFLDDKKIYRGESKEFNFIKKQFKIWSSKNPNNFKHRYFILLACYSHIKGKSDEYSNYISDSIHYSDKFGYIYDKALAYELMAFYYRSKNNRNIFELYIKYAFNSYKEWGALTKCQALSNCYPEIFRPSVGHRNIHISKPTIHIATKTNLNDIDLYSIVKASRIISSEIDLDKLLEKLLLIVTENTGAQNSYLLLKEKNGTFSTKGSYHIQNSTFYKNGSDSNIPRSIINYVARTSDYVVSDNAVEDTRFNKDKIILKASIKSILCTPLKSKGKILGIIYLDNNSVKKAFSPDRVQTIKLLSIQAAISIENAILFKRKSELDKLKLAKQMAEAKTKAKSSFIAHMSHEIRTPLNTILGYSELLKDSRNNNQRNEYTKTIIDSGQMLLSLIDKILVFSKIEKGKVLLNYEPMSIATVFKEVEKHFSSQMKSKGLAFDVSSSPIFSSNLIKFDEIRFKQILLNLIGNAFKFTDKGFVRVSAKNIESGNGKMNFSISVSDSGIGMDNTETIYKEFEQLHQKKRINSGSGLGLAIVNRLVRMMDGNMDVASKLNKGSNFTLTFNNVEILNDIETANLLKSDHNSDIEFFKSTIIVADDNENNRNLICDLLSFQPITILKAVNGSSALKLAEDNEIDLIIMDLRMPILDGFEATKRIKSDETLKEIPIVVLTADITKDTKKKILSIGCDSFLLKPVLKSSLFHELKKYLPYKKIKSSDENQKENPDTIENLFKYGVDVSRELIAEIKMIREQQWVLINKSMIIGDIEIFSKKIIEVGTKYNYEPLVHWGKILLEYSKDYSIKNINRIFSQFPEIVKRLESF